MAVRNLSLPRGLLWLVAVSALLSACSPGAGSAHGDGQLTPSPSGAAPSSTASTSNNVPPSSSTGPEVAPISWQPCQNGLQCGSVPVPLDYAEPGGPWISIAVARHRAEDPSARIGSLVINPGGPGGSGIDDLPSELRVLTSGLLADFDIVSFDPRGVDRSAPVTCGESGGPASQGPLPDAAPPTAAAQHALETADKQYTDQCAAASGLVLPFVGTVDAARDLDRIRAALGDATLTFFGHSYGTLLGLTYADLFPTHVRAMILDGVIDPALSTVQMAEDQASGFEANLGAFFSWCASSGSCPWQEGSDPTTALLGLIQRSRQSAIPAGSGRTAGPGEIYTAVLSALYSSSRWSQLAGALAQATAGNGAGLLSMSDVYDTENGPNSVDANTAINCLDHPVSHDLSAYPGLAASAGTLAPLFGPMLIWSLTACAQWPAASTRSPHAVHAVGSPAILVVGTSGDVATPLKWAVSVAGELAKGVLVTWQGNDHVAYYYSGCVRSIDQAYFLSGALPADRTVCKG